MKTIEYRSETMKGFVHLTLPENMEAPPSLTLRDHEDDLKEHKFWYRTRLKHII